MQFISLWCVKGYDNGLRSAVITGGIYCLILLLSLLLGPTTWLFFFGALLTPFLLLTHRRRLRDSDYPGHWIWLPLLPFIGVIATLVSSDNAILLLIFISLAVCMLLYFSSLKSNRKRVYTQGYAGRGIQINRGNTELSQHHKSKKRVEPTLSLQSNDLSEAQDSQRDFAMLSSESETQAGAILQENIQASTQEESESVSSINDSATEEDLYNDSNQAPRFKFNVFSFFKNDDSNGLKSQLEWLKERIKRCDRKVMICGSSLLVFAMVLVSWWGFNGDEASGLPQAASLPKPIIERHEAKLPDGFSLVFENDILIMRWLGEVQDPQTLWSLAQAKGDKSCAELTFNNGDKYRPLTVSIKQDTAIEARFSPLDNAAIITDIAKRGSVSLCGYKFSLKGSLAILGKNPIFGDYL
ncbi:hypothetical protein [uncultured Shewanella sp.]|uniref:hypothetical protein n=1 Tax=uncultured Shewanella sp. TaxID=173975 RepID=UPI002607D08D|nr:hypothetical protein [uncultured Shewanella sp.]